MSLIFDSGDQMPPTISIRNARLHNLKNVNLEIPKNQLVVLTGISGSGKSTLAFDILNKEGQRQYLESLGYIGDGLNKPPVDAIIGLSPTIAIDQHLTNRSPRSTVGTVTEVFTFLRVLFARLGHRPCPKCGKDVAPLASQAIAEDWHDNSDESSGETFPCPHCGAPIPELGMASFSFNKPDGACPTCTGLGVVRQVVISHLLDESKNIAEGGIPFWDKFHIDYYANILCNTANFYGFDFDPSKPVDEYTQIKR